LSIRQFGRVVDDAYAYFDSALGKLLERMPPEATLLLMSDHGMHAVNSELDFDRLSGDKLERESGGHPDGPPGLLVAVGPHVTADAPTSAPRTLDDLPLLGHVIDVAPTMLALMGLPVGEDMPGKPLTEVIDKDWLDETARPRIPTHDNAEWLADRGGPAAEFPGSEERLRQLESLGYIDRGNR
jgi:arylsulfatase A-like enzyme